MDEFVPTLPYLLTGMFSKKSYKQTNTALIIDMLMYYVISLAIPVYFWHRFAFVDRTASYGYVFNNGILLR